MKFDFYLSAMSISDLTGGGLTMQRILGDSLYDIDYFIHVNRFAEDVPISDKFIDKSINIPSVWDSDLARTTLGRTLSLKLSRKPVTLIQHAKRAAKVINTHIQGDKQIVGLVCPQGPNSVFTLEELKKLRSVKYVTWMMDDHMIEFVDGNWQYPEYFEAAFKDHLQQASHIFVISTVMQDFYKSHFGVESTVIFGSADITVDKPQYVINAGGNLKIGYFGAVAAWQRDALIAVANAIVGTNTQLHIYSAIDQLPIELNTKNVCFEGRISPEEVLPKMFNYDAVLLPIGFDDAVRNMSHFNIATKMSEYLACGVPIIVVGPFDAAMIKYLDEHEAAITVTSNNKEDIITALNLLRDKERVGKLLKSAKKLVEEQVNTQAMRKIWLSVINDQI